jgi:hypothetical protein
MDIPAEAWIASAYGGIILLAAVGRYLTLPRHAAKNDAVLAGVGLEFGSREQTERLIGEVHGIARLGSRRGGLFAFWEPF